MRKVLKSKLNGGNTIRAINSWAVPVIRYTAGIVEWTQAELNDLDRKTRKLMTANHAQSDVDRLYLPRQTGGRGLLQVKQTVEEEKRAFNDYIKNSTKNYLKEVAKEEILKVQETKKEYHKQEINTRKERWQSKALHGQYLKDIEGKVNCDNIWNWLTNGGAEEGNRRFHNGCTRSSPAH